MAIKRMPIGGLFVSQMDAALNRNDSYIIQTDPDPEIREALVKTGGHCPCQVPQDDGSSYCMCQDFRDKLLDPTFYGSCICGLYTKVKR